jgi:hypothetical protein
MLSVSSNFVINLIKENLFLKTKFDGMKNIKEKVIEESDKDDNNKIMSQQFSVKTITERTLLDDTYSIIIVDTSSNNHVCLILPKSGLYKGHQYKIIMNNHREEDVTDVIARQPDLIYNNLTNMSIKKGGMLILTDLGNGIWATF